MPRIGRNDPCPCGSGKKYKKCCQAAELKPHPIHQTDEELVGEILGFASSRFGDPWFDDAEDAYSEGIPLLPEEKPLLQQWSIYHHTRQEGEAPLVEIFLSERGRRLSERQRLWIQAQQAARVSFWQVVTVQPEMGTVQVRDFFSGEERRVYDISMAQSVRPLGVFFARVVEFEGASLLCGAHPYILRPTQAQQVVEELGGDADLPARERAEALLSLWREAGDAAAHPTLPTLSNSDGDPIAWTVDSFSFDPAGRSELVAALEGLGTVGEDDGETVVSFVREGSNLSPALSNTSLGRALVGESSLRIESNSVNRANTLRRQVEEAVGAGRIDFQQRESKPLDLDAAPRPTSRSAENEALMDLPEAQQAIQQLKRQHYERWLDMSIPALGGMTPREAASDADRRAMVRALIDEIEMSERRADHRQRADLSFLRSELQLD